MKLWLAYFAITLPLKIDLICVGPLTRIAAAATGLPVN